MDDFEIRDLITQTRTADGEPVVSWPLLDICADACRAMAAVSASDAAPEAKSETICQLCDLILDVRCVFDELPSRIGSLLVRWSDAEQECWCGEFEEVE